jgi:hypothetical protein
MSLLGGRQSIGALRPRLVTEATGTCKGGWFLLTFADGKRPGSLGGTTECESQSLTDSGLPFDEAVVRCDGSQFQPDRGSGHQPE